MQQLKNIDQKKNIYGLTTGVGDLSVQKPTESVDTIQKNILLSHAIGVGENLSKEVVRATIFSRLITLSQGMSGVSPELILFLIDLLNKDVIPLVPSLGSIGASDLTVLSGIFVSICNKGKVQYKNQILFPFDAYQKVNILYPEKLQTREGLALINGNNASVGLGILLTKQIDKLLQSGLTTGALSLEGRGGTYAVYNSINQDVRQFSGQKKAAKTLENILKNSQQITTDYENRKNEFLQDPPSFKTIAQIFGNAFDTLKRAKEILTTELNSVIDNPLLITKNGDIQSFSSGNYLSPQIAMLFDELSLVLYSIAATSVSRIKILLNDEYNEGLPSYLIKNNTNNSGFMICAYVAESILSEIKSLAFPRSSFNTSVANGWEDTSTNAFNAGLNLERVLYLTEEIQNFEFALGLQAMALRKQKNPSLQFGEETSKVFSKFQKYTKLPLPIEKDADIKDFLEVAKEIRRSNE